MCENAMYESREHYKYIKLMYELKELGPRYKLKLISYGCDDMWYSVCFINEMKNVRYIGCDEIYFYLLATSYNAMNFLYKFNTNIKSFDKDTVGVVIHMTMLCEQEDRIVIEYSHTYRMIYLVFYNMNVSGFECEMAWSSCKFICHENSKIIYSFDYDESICHRNERIYTLLLNTFENSFIAIKNDSIFTIKLMTCMCRLLARMIGNSNIDFSKEKIMYHMSGILILKECELVKSVENILKGEMVFESEPLPILLLRAVVYEHSLLLFRRKTQ